MRALWLEDRQLALRDDVPLPSRDGEALVRVIIAGICNTDIELTRGYYPFRGVPGHEFVGIVDGKRVVGEINAACGRCEACVAGRRTHCEARSVLGIKGRDGAFADYLSLPYENLHEVPDTIPDEHAVFVEPLAAALEIQEQVRIPPGDRILVVGFGKLGRLIAQTLALTGASVTAHRRGDAPPRGPFDIAVECTGNAEGFAIARQVLRPRGTLVMKSTYAGDLSMNASSLVVDEITLIGSRCGPFEPALELLASGAIDVASLIDAQYELRDATRAFDHAQRAGAMKVLMRMA